MANHVRQQIREAVGTLLTGLVTTGVNVFQSRLLPVPDSQLPALKITTNSEDLEQVVVGSPIYDRSLNVVVIAQAKAVSNIDDVLDKIIKEVEAAVAANPTLSNLVKDITLQSIDIDMSAEAEKPLGQALMTFKANYFTSAATPDVSI